MPGDDWEDAIEYPVNGELDLHQFHPRDIKTLVPEYLRECRERGILQVRIVHGKGKGVQRDIVRALLRTLPEVEGFRQESLSGSWGATLVELKPLK